VKIAKLRSRGAEKFRNHRGEFERLKVATGQRWVAGDCLPFIALELDIDLINEY